MILYHAVMADENSLFPLTVEMIRTAGDNG